MLGLRSDTDPAIWGSREDDAVTYARCVGSVEQRRYDRSWKLAASLLGIAALVVAGVALSLVELPSPWELIIYLALIAAVLLGGTLWLVPTRRTNRPNGSAAN